MKTDDLVNLLGTNVEPVTTSGLRTTLMVAVGAGTAGALCLMMAMFGMPGDSLGREHLPLSLLALAFTVGLSVAGGRLLAAAARPGAPAGRSLLLVGALFAMILLAAILALAVAPAATWNEMIFGPQWEACLGCIPLFALAPFASLIWALRKGAPTNLVEAGALAGLVGGALGAAIYAQHHPTGSIPFIVLWYGGPILACTLIGALLGPRLLRW